MYNCKYLILKMFVNTDYKIAKEGGTIYIYIYIYIMCVNWHILTDHMNNILMTYSKEELTFRLVLITSSKLFSSIFSRRLSRVMPAQFTSTEGGLENWPVTFFNSSLTEDDDDMSAWKLQCSPELKENQKVFYW